MELYRECCQPSQLYVVLAILLVPLPVLNSTLTSPQLFFWFLCHLSSCLPFATSSLFSLTPVASLLRSCCDFYQSCPTSSWSVEHCDICYPNNRQGTCCYWCLCTDAAPHKGVSSLWTPVQALKTAVKEQVSRNPFLGQLYLFQQVTVWFRARMWSEAVKHVWKEKISSAWWGILYQDLARGFSHIALVAFLSYFQWQTCLVPSPLLSVSEGKCGKLCCCLRVGWEVQPTPALAEGMIDACCFLEMLLEKSILEFSVIRNTVGLCPSITKKSLGFDPGPPPSLPPFWVLSSHAALILEHCFSHCALVFASVPLLVILLPF